MPAHPVANNGRLIGSRLEVKIPQTATTAFQQHHLLTIFRNVANKLSGLSIVNNRTARNLDYSILPRLYPSYASLTTLTIGGHDMTFIFQVKERPVIPVTTEIHMTSSPSIAPVGTSFRNVFHDGSEKTLFHPFLERQ